MCDFSPTIILYGDECFWFSLPAHACLVSFLLLFKSPIEFSKKRESKCNLPNEKQHALERQEQNKHSKFFILFEFFFKNPWDLTGLIPTNKHET